MFLTRSLGNWSVSPTVPKPAGGALSFRGGGVTALPTALVTEPALDRQDRQSGKISR